MDEKINLKVIAKIYNDYKDKFAIPRQSRIEGTLLSKIVFKKPYNDKDAIRGIEDFSHLWLIWGFSENEEDKWKNLVRPPRLGGNKKVGVFATRSPFRPNPIGLSCVKLEKVEHTKDGDVLIVSGADLKNETPIYDIKPYIRYSDMIIDSVSGFSDEKLSYKLNVAFADNIKEKVEKKHIDALIKILENDPRPAYHNDEKRVYGFFFAHYEIKFMVSGESLKVIDVIKLSEE